MKEALPKNQWGPGPWQDEPDELRWVHAGFECRIYRHMMVTGGLNGYVAVPADHPWWGKDENECIETPQCPSDPPIDVDAWRKDGLPVPPVGSHMRDRMSEPRWSCAHRPESLLEVHGGVTYAGPMSFLERPKMVEEFTWGFGFDTGHAGDISPAMDALLRVIYLAKPNGEQEWLEHQYVMQSGPMASTYKTLQYVTRETNLLADQLAIVKNMGWQALNANWGTDESDDGGTHESRHARSRGERYSSRGDAR